MRRLSRLVGAVVVVVVLVVAGFLLFDRSDGSGGTDGPRPAATASPGSTGVTGAAGLQQYLQADDSVLGSVDGTIAGDTPVTAHAEILAVDAGPRSTVLRWRLRPDAELAFSSSGRFATADRGADDTSGVALIATSAGEKLLPGLYQQELLYGCTCSSVPNQVGTRGIELSGIYPALPDSVTSVQVSVPGFAAVAVPVKRL